MSYCRQEGKDKIIFATKEDHDAPSSADIDFEDDDNDEPGLILPNGDINWNCPCLGGMATGPCGDEFKEAFSCFHYSSAEIKGSDCIDQFRTMQECMREYPELYPEKDDDEDDQKKDEETTLPTLDNSSEKDEEKTDEGTVNDEIKTLSISDNSPEEDEKKDEETNISTSENSPERDGEKKEEGTTNKDEEKTTPTSDNSQEEQIEVKDSSQTQENSS